MTMFQVYLKGRKEPVEVNAETAPNMTEEATPLLPLGDALIFTSGGKQEAQFARREVQGWVRTPPDAQTGIAEILRTRRKKRDSEDNPAT
jgi:hypothetical protein